MQVSTDCVLLSIDVESHRLKTRTAARAVGAQSLEGKESEGEEQARTSPITNKALNPSLRAKGSLQHHPVQQLRLLPRKGHT
jgi:hypothetical protein